MIYSEHPPEQSHAHIIFRYWGFSISPEDLTGSDPFLNHYVPPTGAESIVIVNGSHMRNVQLLGPQTDFRKVPVYLGTSYQGLHLKPGIAQQLFQTDAVKLRDSRIDITHLFDDVIFDDVQEGFGSFLSRIDVEKITIDDRIQQAIDQIERAKGDVKMDRLMDAIPISHRQLQRLFKAQCGLTLKEYAKVSRLRYAMYLMLVENRDVHEVIFQMGYVDQSHYLKDLYHLSQINSSILQTYLKQIQYDNITY